MPRRSCIFAAAIGLLAGGTWNFCFFYALVNFLYNLIADTVFGGVYKNSSLNFVSTKWQSIYIKINLCGVIFLQKFVYYLVKTLLKVFHTH
jgi:hypothetical protein